MKPYCHFHCALVIALVAVSPAAKAQQIAEQANQPAGPAPRENSLGMKLVSVKATPGLLWSIHETREKDYAVYCQEMREGWRKPDFETGPNHPVVYVTPKAASEFCEWLTMRELSLGLIDGTQLYRLPTDEEWSHAAGLSGETGKAPRDRHLTVKGHWAWGQDPHPAPGSGNFPDEAFHLKFPRLGWLRGVDDGFVFSAPVGSFAPDTNGLFDLGGNVSEWVALTEAEAWSRGGAWHPLVGVHQHVAMELGWRASHGPAGFALCEFTGFRVVLVHSLPVTDDLPGHPLRQAARLGDTASVERLLRANRFADLQDQSGLGALHWAASLGHTAVVEQLVRQGASVHLKHDAGLMPLDGALLASKLSPRVAPSARLLIEAGTAVDRDAMDGVPLLALAVMNAPLELVALLIEKGAFPKEPERRAMVISSLGLRRFVERENDDLLAILTRAGGDLTSADRHGQTALHKACSLPRVNRHQLAWLLSHGLDVNARSGSGSTPLDSALMSSRESDCAQDAALFLIEKGARPDGSSTPRVVRDLALVGRNELAAKVVGAGLVFANEKSEALAESIEKALGPQQVSSSLLGQYAMTGDGPLLAAAAGSGVSAQGFDPSLRDVGLTAAAKWGRADMLQILIAGGADPGPRVGKPSLLSDVTRAFSLSGEEDRSADSASFPQAVPALSSLWRRASATADYGECVRVLLAAGAPVDDGIKSSSKQRPATPRQPGAATPDPGPARLSSAGETPLAEAARADRADAVEALLKAGADVEATDVSGFTPLITAAEHGSSGSMRVLLEHGADVNARTHDGTTALILAASFGSLATVELLLARRPDLEAMAAPPRDGSALVSAVMNGRPAVVARLIDAGARTSVWKKEDPRGTLLHSAVRLALQRRANAMANPPPDTPASLNEFLEVIELLVAKGISPDAPSKGSGTPLATACGSGTPSPEALALASKLLALGAKPNVKSPDTPLHFAVLSDPALVRLLLENGADPNATSDVPEKPTPLHCTALHDKPEAARVLLKYGAKPGALDGLRQAPLHMAVHLGRVEMVQVLVAAKADLDQPGPPPQLLAPLHMAAYSGNLEILRILAAAGADPTARAGHPAASPDVFGMTPQRVAAAKGHTEAAALLAKLEQQWTGRVPAKPPTLSTKPAPKKLVPRAPKPKTR